MMSQSVKFKLGHHPSIESMMKKQTYNTLLYINYSHN